MSTLFQEKQRFWGRGEEISYLLDPVLSGHRQLTVIWGDSGIGKTELLLEFEKRVTGGDFLAAYHHCLTDAAADPLIKCLPILLEKQVYQNHENWPGLIGQSLRNLKQRTGALRNPIELARMLVTGLDVLAADPVKKGWAKAVREGLTIGADALSPGTAIPQPMLPPLRAEVFADIVAVLQEAFPRRPLIFILDNLSAEAESSHTGVGTGVLLDFARSGFIHRRDIHFVVAWKHIAKTRPSFQELIETIKQYQGREHRLDPMPRDDADNWLRGDHAWYVSADDQQRREVLRIAKGQPEVIAQWRDQGVATLDFERLKSIENENQRYAPLAGELRREKPKAQGRLFQLAIMPVTLGERALALLWEEDASSVHAFLEEWSSDPDRKGLIKRNDDGYLFAHEKKQEVAREIFTGALFENGAPAARALNDFYLSNVAFPTDTHPLAGYYLLFAFGISAWCQLADTDLGWLSQAARLRADGAGNQKFSASESARLLRAPAPTRFFVFHSSLRQSTVDHV